MAAKKEQVKAKVETQKPSGGELPEGIVANLAAGYTVYALPDYSNWFLSEDTAKKHFGENYETIK